MKTIIYITNKASFYLLGVCLCFAITACKDQSQDPNYVKSIIEHQENHKMSFVDNPQSPITESEIQHFHFFKPDASYSFIAEYKETPDEKPFEMFTYSGKVKNFIKHGELHFEVSGKKQILEAYKNLQYISLPMYKDVLFVPFKDLTNGEDSYGGGRYLDLKISDIRDGKINVDFNKCYNPWCAFSDGYNCPIPPVANHLDYEIRAGEKKYTGPYLQRPE